MKRKKCYLLVLLSLVVIMFSCVKEGINNEVSKPIKARMNSNEDCKYGNVSPKMAEEAAKNFMATIDDKFIEAPVKDVSPILDNDGVPCMYVVNFSPQGNVIVTGDIRTEPIFSYSKQGYFSLKDETIPEAFIGMIEQAVNINKLMVINMDNPEVRDMAVNNVALWSEMSDLNLVLEVIDKSNFYLDDDCRGKPARKSFPDSIVFEQPPLLQTTWEQGEPYNYYIRKKYDVGCVTVAMAQIMKYHKHPSSFKWDIMPNSCDSTYDKMTAGQMEVARLMSDIYYGVLLALSNNSGTFIFPEFAVRAFKNRYGYNKNLKLGIGIDFPKFKSEIVDNKRPIFMCGLLPAKRSIIFWKHGDITKGHAFVIDGYRSLITSRFIDCKGRYHSSCKLDYVHVNFGWGKYNSDNSKWIYINRYLDRDRYKYEICNLPSDLNYCYTQRYITDIYPQ